MSLIPHVVRNGARSSSSSSSSNGAAVVVCVCRHLVPARSFATEPSSSPSSSDISQIPPLPNKPKSNKSRLYPQPRAAVSDTRSSPSSSSAQSPSGLKNLPPTFGRNQLLPVSNDTRAMLESIVGRFEAPIRYAFAYGSGVFEQDGYHSLSLPGVSATASGTTSSQGQPAENTLTTTTPHRKQPMVDFMFAVTHAAHFHSINMQQFPSHYPLHARLFGSSYVSKIQGFGPGVWFNTYIPMNDVTIKYGVTTIDNLCSDLLNWNTLYLAGRMHKPLRIIKDDARVRLTQQVNLVSAVRAALLTLPEEFSETELFERIAGISYSGDPRMLLPAENRGKVGNIVRKQAPQFKELYHRLVVGLPGVHWPIRESRIQQDGSPKARAAHLRKLPQGLLESVKRNYAMKLGNVVELQADEGVYWVHLAGDDDLPRVLMNEMANIVRRPATVQSLKGITSSGLGKSLRYASAKVGKWWAGS